MTIDDDEGYHRIEFAPFGVRLAVIDAAGTITHCDEWDPEILAGVVPVVGDYLTLLWKEDDPDPEEIFQVIDRYYISEFEGDTCWWLLLRASPPSKQHRDIFGLARSRSTYNCVSACNFDPLSGAIGVQF